ncbi:DUF2254 domain-containing protein [Pelagibacterium luteolum]|uniref:Uncharacterized membrane protein n=1 Tax=Pelagibacterium luteolum TaxID=440168 RepID=A0A1G8A5P7_9HYPH|nr:DUF2254 domain-containing protein [Pelagibacterium luteolum]SDH16272.1 Uncharacterized membrane protein [Pelagibacterium luteolum]
MSRKLGAKIRNKAAWDAIRTSFWFVPTIMVLLAPGLAVGGAWADHGTGDGLVAHPWWLYAGTPDAARDLLSTLLASTITMTSLVFSITIVVLTLAASQFGPRLIRNFMASIQTQLVFGTFLMTILYCLIQYAALGPVTDRVPIAMPSATLAIVLVALSVALLIPFIHTLALSIVSETIIERVGRELDVLLDDLEPLTTVERLRAWSDVADRPDQVAFGTDDSGYIQSIDFDELVAIAERADLVIHLDHQPGKFVVPHGRWISVWPAGRLTEVDRKRICETITTGVNRTPVQDVDYPIRHLVEIAVRALSPSLNDPYTAIAVLHRLSKSLARLMSLSLPREVLMGESGAVRVLCPQHGHAAILAASFDQIRQLGAGKPVVVLNQIEALRQVGEHCQNFDQLDAIKNQLVRLGEDASREVANADDQAVISIHLATAFKTLSSL